MTRATEDDLQIHEYPFNFGRHLVEYVLVDHMRHIGAHFDAHATALDHHTWNYRLRNAEFQRLKAVSGGRPPGSRLGEGQRNIEDALQRLLGADSRHEGGSAGGHYGISFCDRQRLVDAILALSDADITRLSSPHPQTTPPPTEEQLAAYAASQAVIADRLAVIVGQRVTITAKRPVQITQGTAEGETPATGTYDPDVEGAEALALSECAINDAGIRIEAISPAITDASIQALTINNALTGRVVTLTPADNNLGLTPHTVAHNATRTLFGTDLRVAWTLRVGKVAASPAPPSP